jgi:hypothetical protein
LLVLEDTAAGGVQIPIIVGTHIEEEPKLGKFQVYANVIVVTQSERNAMVDRDREMVVERLEAHTSLPVDPISNKVVPIDLRFARATKYLIFGARNVTMPSDWGNYSCAPYTGSDAHIPIAESEGQNFDPIASATLFYQNYKRLDNMPADFFTLVEPYVKTDSAPAVTGLHLYSFALDTQTPNASGSANFGRINRPML